ncbi:unnamed protein product, partial [Nesidiocoris tenuis]
MSKKFHGILEVLNEFKESSLKTETFSATKPRLSDHRLTVAEGYKASAKIAKGAGSQARWPFWLYYLYRLNDFPNLFYIGTSEVPDLSCKITSIHSPPKLDRMRNYRRELRRYNNKPRST